MRTLVVSTLILLSIGCSRSTPDPQPSKDEVSDPIETIQLDDVTAGSGVQFMYRHGGLETTNSILEALGGGVGVLDYDRDGHCDIFFPGGGVLAAGETPGPRPSGLFRQHSAFQFDDVSDDASIASSQFYTHGCAVGDFDNDGFDDLLVTGYGGLQLFQNQGDGTFRETHVDRGLSDSLWSSSAAWGDLDGDGNLDLYVVHYVDWSWENDPDCTDSSGVADICPPRSFSGVDDVLYMANGDGTFRDASEEMGLVPGGKGLGVTVADLDLDGDLDVYVANDTVDNFYYVNDGNGKLSETGTIAGLATDDRGVPNGSMGVAVLDFNRDQRPDLWVANYENESFALYRNDASNVFTHASQSAGIYRLNSTNVGFGTVACDIDRDGDEDLVVSNGHVIKRPTSGLVKQKPILLQNEGNSFQRVAFAEDDYFGQSHLGRGLASADFDNNGMLDFVFSHNNADAALIRNRTSCETHWLGVRLIGRRSNRSAIGAKIYLQTSAGPQFRTLAGGGSYLSHCDPRVLLGIPAGATAESLRVVWPSGAEQQIEIDQLDRYIDVIEPADAAN
ncbi:CRTAC1 family protein [Rosistilla oblonga]|uniref:CRTAC1 family protein n=1 Tax=Rosistilla oblonga TaxID=2527990 RepID=UPI003A984900